MPIEPQLLSELPLFTGLTTNELEELASQMGTTHFGSHEVLINEGDAPGHPIYVLLSGSVDVVKRGFDGRARLLTSLSAPSVFGEVELLSRRRAIATVTTMSEVEVATLSRGVFDELSARSRPCILKVIKNLAQVLSYRLAATDERLAALVDRLAPEDRDRVNELHELLGASWEGAEPRKSQD